MPQFFTSGGVQTQIKTTKRWNYVFERDSSVTIEYYNLFLYTQDDGQSLEYASNTYETGGSKYITEIFSTKVEIISTDVVSFNNIIEITDVGLDRYSETGIIGSIWNNLSRLDSIITDKSKLMELVTSNIGTDSKQFDLGISRDIVQNAISNYDTDDIIVSKLGDIGIFSKTIIQKIQNQVKSAQHLLSGDGEHILHGENSEFARYNLDQVTKMATIADSYGEFVDLVHAELFTRDESSLIKSNVKETNLLFQQIVPDNKIILGAKDTGEVTSKITYYSTTLDKDFELNLSYDLSKSKELHNSYAHLYNQESDWIKSPSGLLITKPQDKIFNDLMYYQSPDDVVIQKNLYFGSPDITNVPINNYFKKFKSIQEPKGKFYAEQSDLVFRTEFEIRSSQDIVVPIKPYYSQPDKTYLYNYFYIDIDTDTTFGMVPQITPPTDISYIPDSNFAKTTATTNTNSKSLFKKQFGLFEFRGGRQIILDTVNIKNTGKYSVMDTQSVIFYDHNSAMYGGMYQEYVESPYEFVYTNNYIGISQYNQLKQFIIPHFKIESGHPRNGGSNAYGHDVIPVPRLDPSTKFIPFPGFLKESDGRPSGRHGRSFDQEYRIKQTVTGANNPSNTLYEFEYVDHDMDKDSGGIGQGKYNFTYEIIQGSGRLPECLDMIDQRYIRGRIGEVDAFLRKYSYESWVEEHGHYPLDYDYTDFELLSPRILKTGVLGINSTKGTLTYILENPLSDEKRFNVGEKVSQGSTHGIITDVLYEELYPIDLGDGLGEQPRTIVGLEVQNVSGEFEEMTKNIQYSYNNLNSLQEIDIIISDRQAELANETDPTEIERLTNEIASLQAERDLTGDYTILVVTGSNVSFDFKKIGVVRDNVVVENILFRQEIDTARGLRKIIDLEFPVHNNWSYDRDRFLFTSDKLPDKLYYNGEYLDRIEWINKMRDNGHFRFDNSENNVDIENLINNFKSEYENGELAISKDEYENQLKIYEQMRSLGDLPDAMEYLEDISPFKLNCEVDVTEEDFYNYSQEVRIVRGYPIYASCN